MYIFEMPVMQSGGNNSSGTLMIGVNQSLKTATPTIEQYFARHGREDVEFSDPEAFCEYLKTKFYRDDRQVLYMEIPNSRNLEVFCTSVFKGYEREIFHCGTFIYNS